MKGLYIDSVTKSYDTRKILTDVFLTCKKGEIIGLLGRNGVGKSTLLKIIFGSEPADSKFVKIESTKSTGLYGNRKKIKYLPQDNFIPNHIKVKKVIDLFCDKPEARLLREHKFVKPILHKKSQELSGGERRLLEILLITSTSSRFTLIDEPFNGVAPLYKKDIKELIKQQSANKGFIVSDHDYRSIIDIATRLILVHDGGTKEIKNKEELIRWGYIPNEEEYITPLNSTH